MLGDTCIIIYICAHIVVVTRFSLFGEGGGGEYVFYTIPGYIYPFAYPIPYVTPEGRGNEARVYRVWNMWSLSFFCLDLGQV